jgi:hypothetical protein
MATSACGVCGKDSIEAIRVRSAFDVAADQVQVSPAVLAGLPDQLREAQRVFRSTGGLHAAGLFSADGTLLALREDVGRHNAVDKLAGWALRSGLLPLAGHVLLVSGRASFELAQKAVMMGVPVLAAVSAPSSLAVSLADDAGMTLIGFLRGTTMNVYAGAHRLPPWPWPVRPGGARSAELRRCGVGHPPAPADHRVGLAEQHVDHDAQRQDHDHEGDRGGHVGLVLGGGQQGADRRLPEDDHQQFTGHQAAPGERPGLLEPGHEGRQRRGQDQVPVHGDPGQAHGLPRPQ